MIVEEFEIPGLLLFTPKVFEDDRGYFFETFRDDMFRKHAGDIQFVQENQSYSVQNVLRGLHFQAAPFGQGKLVRVTKGKVLDVAVDLRPNSIHFGKHIAVELSEDNKKQFWIPAGFAHGFSVLSKEAIFCYKCTQYYHAQSDRTLLYNDEELNINWQIENPQVSPKDLNGIPFSQIKNYL